MATQTVDGIGPSYPWDKFLAQPEEAGYTCCQGTVLLKDASTLDRRIDLILFRGAFGVLEADIRGEDPADKTPSGLWPSDHAGVAAMLQIPLRAEAQTASYSSADPPCER